MKAKTLFGEKLKRIRTERGLTQEKFAEFLGTSKQVISRYENNQRNPKLRTVQEFAEKLDISIDCFVNDNITADITAYQKLLEALTELSEDDVALILRFVAQLKGGNS